MEIIKDFKKANKRHFLYNLETELWKEFNDRRTLATHLDITPELVSQYVQRGHIRDGKYLITRKKDLKPIKSYWVTPSTEKCEPVKLNMMSVVYAVCSKMQVQPLRIFEKNRKQRIADARQMCATLIKERFPKKPMVEIAHFLGYKGHKSIIDSQRAIKDLVESGELKDEFDSIKQSLMDTYNQ